MASSDSDSELVMIECRDDDTIESDLTDHQITLSTTDVCSWNLHSILTSHSIITLHAHRSRLIEGSSYFRGLLSRSFCESSKESFLVEWNLEAFLNILKFMYGGSLDLTFHNFLPLLEGALYFGVEKLLLKCKNWFNGIMSSKGTRSLDLKVDDLIDIWIFGFNHAVDFYPEQCTSYLARNFMWAMSCLSFSDVPYDLLSSSVSHSDLVVDSEKHLVEALLVWLSANKDQSKSCSHPGDDCTDILKQIRIGLLPLWFAAGKKKCCYFSERAGESIDVILSLIKHQGSIDVFGEDESRDFRIRLTKYTEKVDLSSCPQITLPILLLSISHSMDPASRKSIDQTTIYSLPTLSFGAVKDVDISKSPMLNPQAAVLWFCRSFPSLQILKAAHCLNFDTKHLLLLFEKCQHRFLSEVDITVDISPTVTTKVSKKTKVSSKQKFPTIPLRIYYSDLDSDVFAGPSLRNLTKLTLEGRNDVTGVDLVSFSLVCAHLYYLNIKGCFSLTDDGIACLLRGCTMLHSIVACDTAFGILSIQVLCSDRLRAEHFGEEHHNSSALQLQTLHVGGCKEDLSPIMSQLHMVKSLCLRDTDLNDDELYSFPGSSLEMLDVSNTMVSSACLTHIVRKNPGLKILKAKGRRNLFQQDQNSELYFELGKKCQLQEIALGWGFSQFSMEDLKPAITSLRAISVGVGGTLGEYALTLLSKTCPSLESIALHFQIISDSIMKSIMGSLEHLQELALCYCFGDVSPSSFNFVMPNLRKLRLERVTPWMNNDNLRSFTQNYANLTELSLLGCTHLNSDSQKIISDGWPGLISLHLEECGEVTNNGVVSLFYCRALEDLLLRHNGSGLSRSFIIKATSNLPMLRKVSLDSCDASDGDFDLPDKNQCMLSYIKIARCEVGRFSVRPVHKETFVMSWNAKPRPSQTVVEERL